MKASALSVALLTATAVLASGCVTHSFFINLRDGESIQYTVEGDSADVVDGLIRLPLKSGWVQTGRERTEGSDGETSLWISYRATVTGQVNHPVGPPEKPGSLIIRHGGSPIHKSLIMKAIFPSWDVKERYGDPDKYLPPELRGMMEESDLDSLPEEKRKEYEAIYWKAQVSAAADRYRRMLDDIVLPELVRRGKEADEESYDEASVGFDRELQTLSDSAIVRGLDNTELDWYMDLRMPMADAARAILGGVTADWLTVADSLEQRYQSWLDLSDERIVVDLLMPGWVRTSVKPDTLMGDTLSWNFNGEAMSDNTVVIRATSLQPRWPGLILFVILIQAIVAVLLHRRYHREF